MTFKKLWKLCEERELRTLALFKRLGMSTQTLNIMRHDEVVSTRSIDKLCTYFKCQPSDIMELE